MKQSLNKFLKAPDRGLDKSQSLSSATRHEAAAPVVTDEIAAVRQTDTDKVRAAQTKHAVMKKKPAFKSKFALKNKLAFKNKVALKNRLILRNKPIYNPKNTLNPSAKLKPMFEHTLTLFNRVWNNKPVRWSMMGIMLPVSGIMTAYAVTEPQPQPQKSLFQVERVLEELPAVYVESATYQGSYWSQEAVQPGDTLSDVLARIGVTAEDIKKVMVKNAIDRKMALVRAGQSVSARFDAAGNVTDIQFFSDDDNGEGYLIAIEKVNGKWQKSASTVEMETMPTLRSVQVRTSARGAMAQAGIPVEIREALSEIFNDVVNIEELSSGDAIRLLYNSMYFRGQEMATGDILAAEVVKDGKTYQAYYYSQGKGDEESGSYYDQNGKSLRHRDGFNVQPVGNARISSPYGLRLHPILRTVKMHTGIDYAAPTGTPIRAAADGILTFKGWKGGYGNTVVLQHSNGIETLYAHMSEFSSAQGSVRAGDIIGYVGSTGRSTGPHLHYEARKNGEPVNPSTVALPTPKLTPDNMAEFKEQQRKNSSTLAAVRNLTVTVAQLD